MISKKDAVDKIVRYGEIKKMIDAFEAEKKAIEDDFKKEMIRKDVDVLQYGDKVVRWTVYSRSQFDSKGFKAANPEEYAAWVRDVESRRFSVA